MEWWKAVFTGMYVDAERGIPREMVEAATRVEVDVARRTLGLQAGNRVLDVPCGEGRMAVELAAQGIHVTGVDLSEPFLHSLHRRAEDARLPIVVERRDMRDLPWTEAFDAAYCLGSSFAYFEDSGADLAFLSAVARTLRRGSRFLLGTHHVLEILVAHFQPRQWTLSEDVTTLWEHRPNLATGRVDSTCIMTRGDETERHQLSVRHYTYREIHDLFERAGFTGLTPYGSPDLKPFRIGSGILYLVATRA